MIEKIKKWWEGKYIPPPQNNPSDGFFIFSPGHYERPLPAKIFEHLKQYLPQEKGWIIKLIVGAIITIIVAAIIKRI